MVVAAVALGGCAGGGAPPSPTTVTVTVAPDSTPAAKPAPPSSVTTSIAPAAPTISVGTHPGIAFGSPTGNINCAAYPSPTKPGAWGVRCDVLERSWTLPPKPPTCEFEWGFGVSLDPTGASLTCASDTVGYEALLGGPGTWWNGQPGSQVVHDARRGDLLALAYGASVTMGSITCQSRQDGMHCTDSTTKAGFDASREAYVLR